jgi:hypothetical protein
MPGSIGDDESTARSGKVAVGNIDGDALLTFGTQTVGEVGKIDLATSGDFRLTLESIHLIFEDRLRIIEHTPDQRALAIVDAAGCGETQQIHLVECFAGRRSSIFFDLAHA